MKSILTTTNNLSNQSLLNLVQVQHHDRQMLSTISLTYPWSMILRSCPPLPDTLHIIAEHRFAIWSCLKTQTNQSNEVSHIVELVL